MPSYSKLYLTRAAAPISVTNKGSWDSSEVGQEHKLAFSKTGGAATGVITGAETSGVPHTRKLYRGVSEALGAQTISGTLQVAIYALEGSASADMAWRLHVWVTVGDTDVVRTTLINQYEETTANEWTTTGTIRELASAQSISGVIQSGDRIVAEIGWKAHNVISSAVTGTIRAGTHGASEYPDAVVGTTTIEQAPFLLFSVPLWDTNPRTIKGSAVLGVKTTVKATRAIAFGLDDATNILTEEGKFKVFGDFEYTGTGTLPGYAPSTPSFVTLATHATLTSERVLTGSARVSVTDAGAGSTVTLDIPNDSINYGRIQNVSAASRILGRGSAAGAGDVEELALGTGISLSGTTLSATGIDREWDVLTNGDVTSPEIIFAGGEVIMVHTP